MSMEIIWFWGIFETLGGGIYWFWHFRVMVKKWIF